jgi:thiol-disulfide isomerase/thioredoxin
MATRSARQREKWLASLDFYAKVPTDLLEGSKQGRMVSLVALAVIGILFFHETRMYLTPKLEKHLMLDSHSPDNKLQVDFNITLTNLKCAFSTINVVSALGMEQNITKDITRFSIDEDGVLEHYEQRNPDQHDIIHYDKRVTQSLEELHENGEDAVSLDPESFQYALEDFEFVFVNFHVEWCIHCKMLGPTWEKLAEMLHDVQDAKPPKKEDYDEEAYEEASKKLDHPVLIARMDCVKYEEFCDDRGVDGFPTIMLYVNGRAEEDLDSDSDEESPSSVDNAELGGEYEGDRTIIDFLHALIETEQRVLATREGAAHVKAHADAAMLKHLNITRDHEEFLLVADRRLRAGDDVQWNDGDDPPGCKLLIPHLSKG